MCADGLGTSQTELSQVCRLNTQSTDSVPIDKGSRPTDEFRTHFVPRTADQRSMIQYASNQVATRAFIFRETRTNNSMDAYFSTSHAE